jgi:hypothetical protein
MNQRKPETDGSIMFGTDASACTGYSLSRSAMIDRQLLDGLKGYGASGYVVNLSLTDNRDWSEFAIEKFRSGEFLYFELL